MAVFEADLTNFKDRSGSKVPEGRYRVRITDTEMGQASTTGAPMMTVFLEIVGGEFSGSALVDRITVQDNTLFRVVNFLQGLGFKTERKRLRLDTSKFLNRVVDVDVADGEPYRGEVRSEIRGYVRVAKSEASSDDGADLPEEAAAPAPEKAADDAPQGVADDGAIDDIDEIEL